MAIMKMVKQKDAGSKAFKESVRYVSDPLKTKDKATEQSAKDFENLSILNRFLQGKESCKRHYKHCIVSLDMKWSADKQLRRSLVEKIHRVLWECRMWFHKKHFNSIGYIHMDTDNPHFHLLIETCSTTGKQYSESPKDLETFKLFVSDQLEACGLNDRIRMQICEITEEEMLESDAGCESGLNEDYFGFEEDDGYDYEYCDLRSFDERLEDDPEQYDNGIEDEYSDFESRWAIIVSLQDDLPKGLLGRLHFHKLIDEVMQDGIKLLEEIGLHANGYNCCTPEHRYFILLVIPECSNVTWTNREEFAALIQRSSLFQTLLKALMRNGLNEPESISYKEVSMEEYRTNECFNADRLDSLTLSSCDEDDVYDYEEFDPSCDEDYTMSDEDAYDYFNRLTDAACEEWNSGTQETFLDRLASRKSDCSGYTPTESMKSSSELNLLCKDIERPQKQKLLCKDIERPQELKLLCLDIDNSKENN